MVIATEIVVVFYCQQNKMRGGGGGNGGSNKLAWKLIGRRDSLLSISTLLAFAK